MLALTSFSIRKISVLFGLLSAFGSQASAEIEVKAIVDPYHVVVRYTTEELESGDQLIVYSTFDQINSGYLLVQTVDSKNKTAISKIISHEKNGQIMVGDRAEVVDFTDPNLKLAGRADLMETESRSVPLKYKHLFYLGQGPDETAETLHKGECGFTLSTSLYCGVTEWMTLSTVSVADLVGLPTLAVKIKTFESDDVTASLGFTGNYYPPLGAGEQIYAGYLDIRSNSKFISHTQLTAFFTSLANFQISTSNSIAGQSQGSSIQSVYEYVLDDWNRLVAGPVFDISRKTLGGVFSYVFLWNRYQLMVGFTADDFSNLTVSPDGYQLRLDMFWRF